MYAFVDILGCMNNNLSVLGAVYGQFQKQNQLFDFGCCCIKYISKICVYMWFVNCVFYSSGSKLHYIHNYQSNYGDNTHKFFFYLLFHFVFIFICFFLLLFDFSCSLHTIPMCVSFVLSVSFICQQRQLHTDGDYLHIAYLA